MECALSYSYCTSHGQLSFSMKKKIDHDVECNSATGVRHN